MFNRKKYKPVRSKKRKGRPASKDDAKQDKKMKKMGHDGKPHRCFDCDSKYHYKGAKECEFSKDRSRSSSSSSSSSVGETMLTQDSVFAAVVGDFTKECHGAAALDSCCTASVAGQKWMDTYLESLDRKNRKKVVGPFKSSRTFQFGNSESLTAGTAYKIPGIIGGHKVHIHVDIIASDIPLLLSKSSMEKAKTQMDFKEKTIVMFGQSIPMITSKAGHPIVHIHPKKSTRGKISRRTSAKKSTSKLFENNKKKNDVAEKSNENASTLIVVANSNGCVDAVVSSQDALPEIDDEEMTQNDEWTLDSDVEDDTEDLQWDKSAQGWTRVDYGRNRKGARLQRIPNVQKAIRLNPNDKIVVDVDGLEVQASVVNRGQASGKFYNCFNVLDAERKIQFNVDLERNDWRKIKKGLETEQDQVFMTEDAAIMKCNFDVYKSFIKINARDHWKEMPDSVRPECPDVDEDAFWSNSNVVQASRDIPASPRQTCHSQYFTDDEDEVI